VVKVAGESSWKACAGRSACLELAPVRRPRRASAAIAGAGAWTTGPAVVAAGIAFLALAPAPAWHLILGIRSSALSIFVIVMAAVVVAPPTVHLVTAVAVVIAATAATLCATWCRSDRQPPFYIKCNRVRSRNRQGLKSATRGGNSAWRRRSQLTSIPPFLFALTNKYIGSIRTTVVRHPRVVTRLPPR